MPRCLALAAIALTIAACHASSPPPPIAAPAATATPAAPAGPTDAFRAHERGCAAGDMFECTIAGLGYRDGDAKERVPMDWTRAVGYLERGCGGRIAEACALLIQIYEIGNPDVAQDLQRVDRLEKQMCADGHPDYCHRKHGPLIELE